MNEDTYEELEKQEQVIDRFNTNLPRVVVGYQKAAIKYSFYNEIPATISFYTLLGSIVKDFITIPDGFNKLDTRYISFGFKLVVLVSQHFGTLLSQ